MGHLGNLNSAMCGFMNRERKASILGKEGEGYDLGDSSPDRDIIWSDCERRVGDVCPALSGKTR